MGMRPKRCTAEVVARIRKIAADNPGLGLRQIAYHFTPPLSHDTVGKVLRGERGVTIGPDGKMLNHKGGRQKMPPGTTKKARRILETWNRLPIEDRMALLPEIIAATGVPLDNP